jgi:sugar-specific transcriptional regulator TrmB
MLKEIKNSLKELGFHENEIKVYIALTQLGEAAAAQIAKKAELPRTTAISILNKLAQENYLTMHRYKGVTYYWVESPHAIVSGLETKIKVAEDLNNLLTDLYRAESHFPHATVYDTKLAIRNFIEKTLAKQKKKSVIYTIDAPGAGNYAKIYSEKIETSVLSKKKTRDIITKTLIPHGHFKTISPHKLTMQNIELRELPPGINFKASLWLVEKTLVHFSGNPPFAVAIDHEAIVDSTKSLFDFLWGISEPKP